MANVDQCKFKNVTLLKDEYLGRGAYGVVYRAKCDQLMCAAKYLHPIFFESRDPGENRAVNAFKQECQLLGKLHHPNIVQYLGTHEEEGINTLILLMEEMDSNLNTYLINHEGSSPLPFHREVDILFDVSLAVDYLHTNGIHHRDLSSKNVLLKGDKAKVSDFGVAKLRDPNAGYSSTTPVPGMMVYMPPEVLRLPPKFANTLDEFSIGVLMIEIMSRKFPDPTDLHVEQEAAGLGGGVLEVIPEDERRKADIALCDQLNPLLQLALCCISNNPQERPSADQISRLLSLLQTTTEYRNSRDPSKRLSYGRSMNPLRDVSSIFNDEDVITIELDDKSGILREVDDLRMRLKEKDQTIAEQQQLLSIREKQLKEKTALSKNAEENLQNINSRVEQQSRIIEEKNRALQDCFSKINIKDRTISDLQSSARDSASSIGYLKLQQSQIDHSVSNYITQIEVLQSSVTEMQQEIKRLNDDVMSKERQLHEKESEIRETRSHLIQRERELMNVTLRNVQRLKSPNKRGK